MVNLEIGAQMMGTKQRLMATAVPYSTPSEEDYLQFFATLRTKKRRDRWPEGATVQMAGFARGARSSYIEPDGDSYLGANGPNSDASMMGRRILGGVVGRSRKGYPPKG